MRAKDVMSDGVMSVAADATVFEAAKLLVNSRVSAMPVLDDKGIMIGIVSEADLIQRTGAGAGPDRTGLLGELAEDMASATAYVQANSRRVSDVMTKHVISVDEDPTLSDVAELMLEKGIKRVPVRRGHSVVGMVSRVDLVQALITHRPAAEAAQSIPAPRPAANQNLRREVEQALRGRSWSLARRADVVVQDGVAHIWGVVPSDMVRRAYRVAAENVPGVKAVENHMHVVPPSPMRLGL